MKVLRTVLAAMLLLGLAVGTTGCGDSDVAARVNGEEIKKSDLDAQVDQILEQYPEMFEGSDGEGQLLEFQQRLLDQMINEVLLKQAAEERGIEVTDADVDAEIENLKTGFQSDEQFEQALAQSGMDLEALRKQVRDSMVTDLLIQSLGEDAEVTDEEIEEYYEAHKTEFFQEAAVRAAHILFAADDKATAEKVLAEVKGGADFATLAQQYSQDPGSAANGGDLGWPTTAYVAEFEAAANSLDVGEVSDLVETTFGWHIIKVLEKRDDHQQTIDEVRDQIEQTIIDERSTDAYQEFLNELRDAAEIEIVMPELATPAVTQPGEGSETEE